MELEQEIIFEQNEELKGQEIWAFIEGKVADENAYVGRTYRDAPGVDGYIFINTEEELMSGAFVKVRVTGAYEYDLIGLVATGQLASWIVIIIISREFIISGFRLIAADNGIVIAASYWGKFKTVFQMLMIIVLILDIQNAGFQVLGVILTYVALILTVVSLIDYIVKNKQVLKEQK